MRSSPAKAELRGLLEGGRFERIAELAEESRRVLGTLLVLTYDPDDLVAWRAVEATGIAAARVVEDDPAYVREHLRRLFWLITEESGGICWRAPETMASVVERIPHLFEEFVPIIAHLLREMADEDLDHFRPGILWALGHLGPLAGPSADDVMPLLAEALDDPKPKVRGTAVWCLGRVGRPAEVTARPHLGGDDAEFGLYRNGAIRPTTVARAYAAALDAAAR